MAKKDIEDQDKEDILKEVLGEEYQGTASQEEPPEEEVAQETDSVGDDDAAEQDEGQPADEEQGEELDLDPAIVERAQQYGLDVSAFDSSETVEAALASIDRLWTQVATRLQQEMQRQPQAQQQPQEAPQPEQTEFDEYLSQLDEDDPSRLAIHGLQQRLAQTQTQLEQLMGYAQTLSQYEYQRQVDAINDRFQMAFDGLDTKLYGKSDSLTEAQLAARNEAAQTAMVLYQHELSRGVQADPQDVLRRGAQAVHATLLSKELNKPTADRIRERSMRRSSVGTRKRTGRTAYTAEEKNKFDLKPSLSADIMASILEAAGIDT